VIYNSSDYSEYEKHNLAFQTIVAIREATGIAKRTLTQVRYEDAMDILYDIDPGTYAEVVKRLVQKNKNEEVDLAIARAQSQSTVDEPKSPEDVLQQDLARYQREYKAKPSNPLKKKIQKTIAALEWFKPREPNENEILNQDFFLAKRNFAVNEPIYEKEKSKDFRLADDKILRMRLFHPDNEEHIVGTDLVYEQYDLINERVRFSHLQYKVWDKEAIYFSQGSISAQLDKLETHICKGNFCRNMKGNNYSEDYRLPYCSAFLRPTDEKQGNETALITSGFHIPVCKVINIKNEPQVKITKSGIKERSISHGIFEEMFVNNLLGSRWMSFDELQSFYDKIAIESNLNSIRLHVQEISIESEAQAQLRIGR